MNRALRAATVSFLLLTPVVLTACGAGQDTQTATQIRDKTGPSAQIGDLSLRQVLLDYPDTGSYVKGDSAQLRMSVVNSGPDSDALVGISGDGFDGIDVVKPASSTASASPTGTAGSAATGSSASASSATQTAGNSVGGGASNPTAASGSSTAAGATATATSSPAGSAGGSGSLNIPIPAHSAVFIGATDAPSVFLTGLTQGLTPAQHLRLTFTFQKAGQVTIDVTVAGPNQVKARSSGYNFSEQPSSVTGGNE